MTNSRSQLRSALVSGIQKVVVVMVVLAAISHELTEAQNNLAMKSLNSASAKIDVKIASGRVFVDSNNDGHFSSGEIGLPQVGVSNGKQIVLSDSRGHYQIPLAAGQILFLIKPSGYRTALSKNLLPRFYYNHQPDGSPKLKYPGIAATGPLPKSINFPLYAQQEPKLFKTILFGDPQPKNLTEVGYVADDIIPELVGTDASFGVTLGDIVFDDLSCLKPMNQSVALIGIPWYNVIGNHDVNGDGKNRRESSTTFEKTYGPTYYSFNHGSVHFVVLDNIDFSRSAKSKAGKLEPRLGRRQLKFLENDLALVPDSKLVVLLMHVPLVGMLDKHEVFRRIEKRSFCISISGHTHFHSHHFIDKKLGWNGKKPHHHIINVTVSGSWWGGRKDERGIPHTTMTDGAPNGYSVMAFDGTTYQLDFFPAGRPASYQMNINLPGALKEGKSVDKMLIANVFNATPLDLIEARIGSDGPWHALKNFTAIAPTFRSMFYREKGPDNKPLISRPRTTNHLWKIDLNTLGSSKLRAGHHLVQVRWKDQKGRLTVSNKVLRIVADTK